MTSFGFWLEGLRAGDDAKSVEVIPEAGLLNLDFAFDHKSIVADYLDAKAGKPAEDIPRFAPAPQWRRSVCSAGG